MILWLFYINNIRYFCYQVAKTPVSSILILSLT